MLQKMSAREARDNFTDLLGAVYYGKEPIAVEKKGRVYAIVIHPEEYENLKKAANVRLFELIGEIQEHNKDITEEQVMADVTPIIEEIRQANYDKQNKKGRD